jgi:hypothetical protein
MVQALRCLSLLYLAGEDWEAKSSHEGALIPTSKRNTGGFRLALLGDITLDYHRLLLGTVCTAPLGEDTWKLAPSLT